MRFTLTLLTGVEFAQITLSSRFSFATTAKLCSRTLSCSEKGACDFVNTQLAAFFVFSM